MDAYQNLANAIIVLAVKDYEVALARYMKFPNDITNVCEIEELKHFFRSGWFQMLSDLNGEQLMLDIERMLKKKGAA